MRLKSGYRRADRSNSQRNEWIEPYGEDEKREGGGMMADGGGTFRCATMLCGNNAQTNDSAVPTVITRGTRSFFPLLNPLSQPPSNQLSFCVYPFVPLSFLVSLVHLPIHVYTGLPLSLSLSNVPRPSSSTPFSLLWLLNQRTSATTIDPPTLEPLVYLVHRSTAVSIPVLCPSPSMPIGKRELGHQSTSTGLFCRIFFVHRNGGAVETALDTPRFGPRDRCLCWFQLEHR